MVISNEDIKKEMHQALIDKLVPMDRLISHIQTEYSIKPFEAGYLAKEILQEYTIAPKHRKIVKKGIKNNCLPNRELVGRLFMDIGNIGIIVGEGNSGKTFFAQYLALCVRNKYKLFNLFDINEPGPVLHLDVELQGENLTTKRYEVLSEGMNINNIDIDYQDSLTIFNPAESFDNLVELYTKFLKGYKLVILDSLSAFINGDENNNTLAGHLMRVLKKVAQNNEQFILIIAHTKKGGAGEAKQTVKGASQFYNGVDIQIKLEVEDPKEKIIRLTHNKIRDGKYPDDLIFKLMCSGEYLPEYRTNTSVYFELTDEVSKIVDDEDVFNITRTIFYSQPGKPIGKSELETLLHKKLGETYRDVARALVRDKIESVLVYNKYIVQTKDGVKAPYIWNDQPGYGV